MKIRPVGTELLHADRQKDGKTEFYKLIASFRNISNAPQQLTLPGIDNVTSST
jgi:hypothetical protein